MIVRLFMLLSVLLLASASLPGAAQAAAGQVGAPLSTCLLRDMPGLDAKLLLKTPERFDCTTPQRDFGPGNYWVMAAEVPVINLHTRLAVRSTSIWQDRMTLYALYPDGEISTIHTDDRSASETLQLGAIFQSWLPRHDAHPVRLLWHIEGVQNLRGIMIAPTIATSSQIASSNTIMGAIYAAFAGLCVALLLYNVGLTRALKHRFLPFYCLMMVGMLLYALSSSGALAWFFPDIRNTARLRINYVVLGATGIGAINFLRHFFEPHVISPWVGRLVKIGCAAVALPAIAIALVPSQFLHMLDTVYALGFLLLLSSVAPIMINAWIKRSQFLLLCALAWIVPIVLAVARNAYALDLIGYSFWLENSTILSMAFEALLSSLAIAYRILLITRERDLAREQEIAARMLADADPLTGLMNRRGFLREAIGRDHDQQLLLIDIDHFKHVNDTIGHHGGDEVLRLVARILRVHARHGSLIARIGGEEFAILTPVEQEVAPDLLLAGLRAARMPFDLSVTASIGSCTGGLTREADWKAMYCAADRALFEAKAEGRDRHRAAQHYVAVVAAAAA